MPKKDPARHNLKAVPKIGAQDTFAEMDSESQECPKCFGTGMEVVPGRGARICDCRKLRSQSGHFDSVRLPKRYDGFHFHNFTPQNDSQKIAHKLAMRFNHDYPAVDRGLLFMGSVGIGKTHLAVSILKGLTERGFKCLFYDFAFLLKEIQDSYNPSTHASELSVLAPVLRTDILVLDELGASKPTDWVRDTMAHVINTRYNDKKHTILTTNYLDERRRGRDEILEDRIGVRLRSRLYEMCKTVMIDGKDYRKNFDRSLSAER